MNVIYNESKTIQKKNEIDSARPEENRKARIHNAIWITATIFLGLLFTIFAGWIFIKAYGDVILVTGFIMLTILLVAMGGWVVIEFNFKPVYKPGEYYYTPILYYVATKDKKILDHTLIQNGNTYKLVVVLADENNIVTKYTLPFDFHKKHKLDIPETTVDLEKDIVYIPYIPTENED